MSGDAHSFKPGDFLKYVKVVLEAGTKLGRMEMTPGKIVLFFAGEREAAAPTADLDLELAAFEAKHGQD
jgi:hypothetical protein